MTTALLDLDDPATWHHDLHDLVYAPGTWEILLADFQGPCSLYSEIGNLPQNIRSPIARLLRDQCENTLRTHYTHVTVYHACRTTDPNQYLQNGILTSSRERLIPKANVIFQGIQRLDEALAASDSYFDSYGGTVSLYTTAKDAPRDYLSGSHYLMMVERELMNLDREAGIEATRRLSEEHNNGQSIFVKCHLPITWLNNLEIVRTPELPQYSITLLKKLIGMRAENRDHYPYDPGALIVKRPLGPELLSGILEPVRIHRE